MKKTLVFIAMFIGFYSNVYAIPVTITATGELMSYSYNTTVFADNPYSGISTGTSFVYTAYLDTDPLVATNVYSDPESADYRFIGDQYGATLEVGGVTFGGMGLITYNIHNDWTPTSWLDRIALLQSPIETSVNGVAGEQLIALTIEDTTGSMLDSSDMIYPLPSEPGLVQFSVRGPTYYDDFLAGGSGRWTSISYAYGNAVPEPNIIALFLAGLIGIGLIHRRKENLGSG